MGIFKKSGPAAAAVPEKGVSEKSGSIATGASAEAPPRPSHASDEPPPAYSAEAPYTAPAEVSDAELAALTAALSNLQPSATSAFDGATLPGIDTCLAHLKFLSAVHDLKEEVGYSDGLFGLADEMAAVAGPVAISIAVPTGQAAPRTPEDRHRARLSKVREKRWALYVARAVDRYEAWWAALPKDPLREADMEQSGSPKYNGFPEPDAAGPPAMRWDAATLLPLDVLMVLHAHMLNPRAFLEDCLRAGVRPLWHAGFPWDAVDAAIEIGGGGGGGDAAAAAQCRYAVPAATQARWTALTGRQWDNERDAPVKQVCCPACRGSTTAPWTTCGSASATDLRGHGYGDGAGFSVPCASCGFAIDHKALAFGKFAADCRDLVFGYKPMPGSVLDPKTGTPSPLLQRTTPAQSPEPRTFPNRLVLRSDIASSIVPPPYPAGREIAVYSTAVPLLQPGAAPGTATMELVRERIESALSSNDKREYIDEIRSRRRTYRSHPVALLSVRKMMSRYWDNASPFALDLGGAVLRQGVFVDKMHSIDWLHSPAARATMERILVKYDRFLTLMADHPQKLCVPTLDVDLAWHTHQLLPPVYYAATTARTGKFIDHDDKIDEDKLDLAFQFTSDAYQAKYGEVYSACTCWYCEAVRAEPASSLRARLGLTRQRSVADAFHAPGVADCFPPDRSAHISSHNAVLFVENGVRGRVTQRIRAAQRARLDANYQKAVKRARARGRTLPPREQYYDHWGYQYYMYSPYMYPVYYDPGYYGSCPGAVPVGDGEWANCAGGTCGSGGVAAGACGGPGGCGSCGSITGGCAGSSGGCGGGGGGGGGGGCGGGGGGGGCGGGGGGC